jgi:hypothetical protein
MQSMWPGGLRGVGSELGVEGRCRRALSRPVVSGDANARLVLGTASGRIAQPRTGDDVQQRDLQRVKGQINKLETGTMVTISISRKSRTGVAAGRCGRVG